MSLSDLADTGHGISWPRIFCIFRNFEHVERDAMNVRDFDALMHGDGLAIHTLCLPVLTIHQHAAFVVTVDCTGGGADLSDQPSGSIS